MPQAFIEIKCTQFDSKKELRRLVKRIADILMYNVTVGIHKGEGRLKPHKSKRYNLASLAQLLENGASWTQSKTVRIPTVLLVTNSEGEKEYFATIKAGTKVKIPPRIFITLPKIPSLWNAIKQKIDTFVISFLSKDIKNGKEFWKNVGEEVEYHQKSIIQTPSLTNRPLTEAVKGFNHPLFHTGKLLKSIKYRINKEWGKNGKHKARLDETYKLLDQVGLKSRAKK